MPSYSKFSILIIFLTVWFWTSKIIEMHPIRGLKEKNVFCIPRESQRLLSLLSMRGVCGRSLTARKILFTGRQTCSLYLVLWLCGWFFKQGILMGIFISWKIEGCIMYTSQVLIIIRCHFSVNCDQLEENNIRCTLYWYMPC